MLYHWAICALEACIVSQTHDHSKFNLFLTLGQDVVSSHNTILNHNQQQQIHHKHHIPSNANTHHSFNYINKIQRLNQPFNIFFNKIKYKKKKISHISYKTHFLRNKLFRNVSPNVKIIKNMQTCGNVHEHFKLCK